MTILENSRAFLSVLHATVMEFEVMYRENQFLILCTNICSICPIIFTWMVTISGIFINDLLLGETLSLISVKQAKKRKILMWKYVQLQAHDFFSSMPYNTHYLYKIVFSQNLITEHNNPIEDLIWHVCVLNLKARLWRLTVERGSSITFYLQKLWTSFLL